MLGGEPAALLHQLAQPLGMSPLAKPRIEADSPQGVALLEQPCEGAVTCRPRCLPRPHQATEMRPRASFKQAVQPLDLCGRQAAGQLAGDVPLGAEQGCGDQALDPVGPGTMICRWRSSSSRRAARSMPLLVPSAACSSHGLISLRARPSNGR